MAKILTAKSVENTKAEGDKRREIPDGVVPGLYLQVQASNAKSWALRYRFGGKTRKLTLGSAGVLTLAEARARAREALGILATGVDPGVAKLAAKADARVAQATGRDLVSTIVADFLKRHASKNRTGDEVARYFTVEVLPLWADRRIQDVTKRDLVELLDRVVDRGAPIAANRLLAHVRTFFGWAVSRGVIEVSPAAGVKAPGIERSRDRVLGNEEIRAFWAATERLAHPFGPLYRVLLLTGQRLGEVAEMTGDELGPAAWTIPAARSKNGASHLVPLSEPALDTLASVKRVRSENGFVFTTNGKSPVSGFAVAKKRLDKEMASIVKQEIPPFVIHDLRRTCASGMAALGIAPHLIEAVLNHKSGQIRGIAAVYNRHAYELEKRLALEAWASYVLGLVGEKPAGANVVALSRPAK